jgi:putative transcriptional regulator
MESLSGKLLVASPALEDLNFRRTVVYVCTHDERGAMGLVLNRPVVGVEVVEHLPEWAALAAEPGLVFSGGPVQPDGALAMGRGLDGTVGAGWTGLTGELGLVDLRLSPKEVEGGVGAVRVFAGYSGWSAGQLEGEMEEEGWFAVGAEAGDVFTADPLRLWHDVLWRQGGRLAMFALVPENPRAN